MKVARVPPNSQHVAVQRVTRCCTRRDIVHETLDFMDGRNVFLMSGGIEKSEYKILYRLRLPSHNRVCGGGGGVGRRGRELK